MRFRFLTLLTLFCLPTIGHSQQCIDTDGDGWGWDGTSSCLVEQTTNTGGADCIDSDGDGWGWDGTSSCRIEQTTNPDTNTAACVDSDGDGWGWDGTSSCRIEQTTNPDTNTAACIDADGDGWGWDGTSSCRIEQTTNPDTNTAACVDTDGDGWGWNGTSSCRVDPVMIDPDTGNEDQTGPISGGQFPIGGAGTASMDWDGSSLTGLIEIAEGIMPAGAALYTGIAAAGNGQPAVFFNGNGNPNYLFPSSLSADQQALIADNIVAGNLYIQVDLADGTSQDGIILLDGVQPTFSAINGSNNVPPRDWFSSASGFLITNTVTGDFTAVVNINLSPFDLDNNGDPQIVTAVHIHEGAVGVQGPVIAVLADSGDGSTWAAQGAFSMQDLQSVLSGNTYFNVHRTDDGNFIRGQIPATN